MSVPDSIRIQILSTPVFVEKFKSESTTTLNSIQIVESKVETDATKLAFGLAEVAAVVAIVQGVFYLGELSVKIYQWMQETKTPKLVIQTPIHQIEIFYNRQLTEAEIRQLLHKSVEL